MSRAVRLLALALALAVPPFAAPAVEAQALADRILQVQDARELSADAQATIVEGLKDPTPRVRMLAVRAAGRFESPALVGQIVPLLGDQDRAVRHAAAIAAADAAKVFPMQAIDALRTAMGSAPPADWAVFGASLARIALPDAAQFTAVESLLAAGLPAVALRAQAGRPSRSTARPSDPIRTEGAARGLEALVRVNGRLGTLSPDTRARLYAVVEMSRGSAARGLTRARRLALLALRTARAVDGDLATIAARDPDDEVRRLALTAVATPDAAAIGDEHRTAVLRAGLKDAEPRVRLEALRGWGRQRQATDCQPVIAAVSDASTHVALQALDLLGAGCESTPDGAVPPLRGAAEALPSTATGWHRAAHAIVALARVGPGEARLLLPRFVGHSTWQVRMYAARAAGRMSSIETLVRLGADAHDNVRQAALDELSRLKRPEALAVAYDALLRPDFQLQMTAARALAADDDRARATAALLAALDRLTVQGHDTSRDPRLAILTTLASTGTAADAARLARYLEDWDPRVAELAARALTQWTGGPAEAAPRPRTRAPLDLAAVNAARGKWLRITMAGGGVMDLRLLPDEAPATVARVTSLAKRGYYNGLTFHRVEPTFVLQGGSPGANEFMGDGIYMRDEPGVAHQRGTVGISTRGRDTGDAQIFVNLVDSPRLDHAYTVFAVVERGMDVADRVLEGDVLARVELVDAPRR
jgi:cyclophilin family peptidyl-prolyl cis-trans isomerase/HEAT repeat protein